MAIKLNERCIPRIAFFSTLQEYNSSAMSAVRTSPLQFVSDTGLPPSFYYCNSVSISQHRSAAVVRHRAARATGASSCTENAAHARSKSASSSSLPRPSAPSPPAHLLLVGHSPLLFRPADPSKATSSHHVCRAERRCRLPHLRPPQHARALPAAAGASRILVVAARARARVAAAVVPRQHAARAAAVLLLPAVYLGFSPVWCRQQV